MQKLTRATTMEIKFLNEKVRRYCLEKRACIKMFGSQLFKRLKARLADISAARSVTELPYGNPHRLLRDREGQYSIKLYKGYRLVFKPTYPDKVTINGDIDWSLVDSITILEIVDYH